MEQFCFHLGLSVPKDPITLWPVRSLWAPFNMSEASGRWFYNCVLLASEDKTQASSCHEKVLSRTRATPTTMESNETPTKPATTIVRSVTILLFH